MVLDIGRAASSRKEVERQTETDSSGTAKTKKAAVSTENVALASSNDPILIAIKCPDQSHDTRKHRGNISRITFGFVLAIINAQRLVQYWQFSWRR